MLRRASSRLGPSFGTVPFFGPPMMVKRSALAPQPWLLLQSRAGRPGRGLFPSGARTNLAFPHLGGAMHRDDYIRSMNEARREAERATDPYFKDAWTKLADQYEQLVRRPGFSEPTYRKPEPKSWD